MIPSISLCLIINSLVFARSPTMKTKMQSLLLVSLSALVAAQQTIVNPTTAAPNAGPLPTGIDGYTYAGCWNETTGIPGGGGARALQQGQTVSCISRIPCSSRLEALLTCVGNQTASNVMTIDECLSFCGDSSQYAGLEYGESAINLPPHCPSID